MHLVGDRFSLPRNILAPFTAGSNEVFFFSRWGIWAAVANVKITDNDHVPITISWKQSTHTVDEDVGTLTLNAVLVTTKDKAPESGFSVSPNPPKDDFGDSP